MRQMMLKLWKDDAGVSYTSEIILVLTILGIGLITGLVALRQAVITELGDISHAFLSLNQSYSFSGQSNCQSTTAGSAFNDTCDSIPTTRVNPVCVSPDERACD
jgi:hypothetical protein